MKRILILLAGLMLVGAGCASSAVTTAKPKIMSYHGDIIKQTRENGDFRVDIPFVVRATRTYDAAADARDVFISTDGKAHLNIITCDGKWDKSAGQYTKRLVVFADEEVK